MGVGRINELAEGAEEKEGERGKRREQLMGSDASDVVRFCVLDGLPFIIAIMIMMVLKMPAVACPPEVHVLQVWSPV